MSTSRGASLPSRRSRLIPTLAGAPGRPWDPPGGALVLAQLRISQELQPHRCAAGAAARRVRAALPPIGGGSPLPCRGARG
eukprot:scaffold14091_cov121-Isochrysis_galbana.AAC.2